MKKSKHTCRLLACGLILFEILTMLNLVACGATKEWSRYDAQRGVVCVFTTDDSLDNISLGHGSGFGVGKTGEATNIFVTNRHVVFNDDTGHLNKNIYIPLEDGAVTVYHNREAVRIKASDVNEVSRTKKVFQDKDGNYFIYSDMIVDAKIDKSKLIRCEVLYPREGDPEYPDIAIIRAESKVPGHVAIPLKSGFQIRQGDDIYTMGFPASADDYLLDDFGLYIPEPLSASISSVTVDHGVISRIVEKPEFNNTTLFQHTAPMNHGNSGGPLVDAEGYAVGINTYVLNPASTIYENIAYNGISEYKASLLVDYAMKKLDALGIPYDKYTPEPAIDWKMAAAATVGVMVVIAAAVYLMQKKPVTPEPPKPERPAYRLQGVSGVYAGKRYPIDHNVRIGREPSGNDLVFPPQMKTISGMHCALLLKDDGLYIQDNNSKNGTFVNGNRLNPGATAKLKVNDTFSLAGKEQSFIIDISHHQKRS